MAGNDVVGKGVNERISAANITFASEAKFSQCVSVFACCLVNIVVAIVPNKYIMAV